MDNAPQSSARVHESAPPREAPSKAPQSPPETSAPTRTQSAKTRALTATVGALSVPTLVQAVASTGRPATITLEHEAKTSLLWVVDGEVHDAQSGRHHAEAAAYRILGIEQGVLTADFGGTPRNRTIQRSLQHLLLEAAYRQDTRRQLQQELCKDGTVYCRTSDAPMPPMGQDAIEAMVLRAIDGERTLPAIVGDGHYDSVAVLTAWMALLERGWIELAATQPDAGEASGEGSPVSVVRPIPVAPGELEFAAQEAANGTTPGATHGQTPPAEPSPAGPYALERPQKLSSLRQPMAQSPLHPLQAAAPARERTSAASEGDKQDITLVNWPQKVQETPGAKPKPLLLVALLAVLAGGSAWYFLADAAFSSEGGPAATGNPVPLADLER